MKLCEYMAFERPVVTSRISGLEIVEAQEAGILVASEEPKELADAIVRLLGARELSVTMGQNGRRYAVQERSWECVARSVAVCQQAMEEHRRDRD